MEKIETLRKIDVVDYDTVRNQYLRRTLNDMENKFINRYNTFADAWKI